MYRKLTLACAYNYFKMVLGNYKLLLQVLEGKKNLLMTNLLTPTIRKKNGR
jgi:hypothetical protein